MCEVGTVGKITDYQPEGHAVPADLVPRGFGPPGPNPLADLVPPDPHGGPNLLADLVSPCGFGLPYFRDIYINEMLRRVNLF